MSSFSRLKKLTKQLLPRGRAYRMPVNGDKLIESTSEGQSRMYDDIISTLDTILPDNANFTAGDAEDWEIRLGMLDGSGLDLEVRKMAIKRKMNYPGEILARTSADYLEGQILAAGFEDGIYVYENVDNLTIEAILSTDESFVQLGDAQMGDEQLGNPLSFFAPCLSKVQLNDVQMGPWQMGTTMWCEIIANNLDVEKDRLFYIGENNRTFVVGGPTFGSFGNVDEARRTELRDLLLKIKPAKSVAYLLLNNI